MLPNHVDYDPSHLKARLVQQHGAVLGAIVFDAEFARRQMQDARAAELTAELATLNAEISKLRHAAGERRAKAQVQLTAAYSEYLALCSEDAMIESSEEATIAPLTARSLDLQQQMRDIALPRLSERELQDVALFASTNAERLRASDKKLPPLDAPPLSELARINGSVELQKPR